MLEINTTNQEKLQDYEELVGSLKKFVKPRLGAYTAVVKEAKVLRNEMESGQAATEDEDQYWRLQSDAGQVIGQQI